jgi:hypothetical protein
MNKHFKFPFWNPELEQVVEDFIKSVQVDNTKDFGWSGHALWPILKSPRKATSFL